jgi:vacuolar-type H+-ATPase subunit F/Vma7
MKNLALIFALLFTFTLAHKAEAQTAEDAISKYFSKYVDDERFTVVYISGKMFDLFGRMELDLEDDELAAVQDVVKELKGLRILVAEENVAGLYDEAVSSINTTEYEVLMQVRSADEENVQFLVKDDGETLSELLLLVGGQDEFVLMSFIGNLDLSNIGKLAEAFEDGENEDDNDEDR